jgi:uncharacterized protein (TIGR03790 family)
VKVFGLCLSAFLTAAVAFAQKPENVMVVVNDSSPLSLQIGDYYIHKRAIPTANVCHLKTDPAEDIQRAAYNAEVAKRIANCLRVGHLEEQILYIVTTAGVPLRIAGSPGTTGINGDYAAVDSELTLLYADLHGQPHPLNGAFPNPFFGHRDAAFRHPQFPMYLVTRLAGYDFNDVKAIIDKGLVATNRGKFVIDLRSERDDPGNDWLRNTAILLPTNRVILDESDKVLYNQKEVIGYASWGSNDSHRKERLVKFEWLPGAIMTEFVSTNGRTFKRPPDNWNIGTWNNNKTFFAGTPQSLTADYIHEGATGASGHVDEPYLSLTPRPDYVLPAYYSGRNLAESFYVGIPALSWQNIVVGDPLCSLGKP